MKQFFRNKTVCISGAASGLGREIAIALAKQNANLVLIDTNVLGLEALRASCCELGSSVIVACCDVSQRDEVARLRDTLPATKQNVDVLIANAGITSLTDVDRLDHDLNARIMATNYFGTVYLIAAFLPQMIARESGQIVGISSLAGLRGLPNAGFYAASKSAQSVFLESLRLDVRKHGIRVSAVYPGFINTTMNDVLKDKYHLGFMIAPETAAKKILAGVSRQKSEIAFPWVMAGFILLSRFLPIRIYDLLINFGHNLLLRNSNTVKTAQNGENAPS